MLISEREAEFGPWGETGYSRNILYSHRAMDEILMAVMDKIHSFGQGGGEAVGVLFGDREGDVVRIADSRVLELERAEEDLERLLEEFARDESLGSLTTVGWYRSCAGRQIRFSEADAAIYGRFFPEPWQITMILRPGKLKPVQACLFFREQDGSVTSEPSFRQFETEESRWATSLALLSGTTEHAEAPPEPAVKREAPPHPEPAEPPAPALPTKPARAFPWKKAVLLAVGLVFVAAVAVVLVLRFPRQQPAFSLAAAFVGDGVQIEWNPSAPPIQSSQRGLLEIVDGGTKTMISLGSDRLRTGSIAYQPKTDDVLVRLKVLPRFGAPVEEILRVLGHPASPAAAAPSQEKSGAEAEQLRTELQSQAVQSAELEAKFKTLQERAKSLETPQPRAIAKFQPPARKQVVQQPPAIAALPPSLPPEQVNVELPRPAALPPPPPPVSAAKPAAPALIPRTSPPKPAQPTSGKLIWTGTLQKSQTLSIEGRRASTGFLNGELPQAPIRIGVYSADLSGKGLTVYTSNAKYRDPARATEAPGPQNGWNRTVYTWDPKHSNDIVVTEAPGPQNGWSRLVLRCEAKLVSVIVLEWQRAQ